MLCNTAIASDSYTEETKTGTFIYNETGLPFSVQAICWVGVSGTDYDDELRVDEYDVSGAIVNGYCYPISMAMQHQNSKLYSGSTLKATYYNSDLAYYSILIPSSWIKWCDYGRKTNCNKWFNANYSCKAKVSSWWVSNDSFPTSWQPTFTHYFWNNGWLNDY